ncbi:MAG: prolyl oligopeptidase family serine peptidase [Bacteroidota bacterium]|nr:prolyl oligopeptidase family serine peptidase [Bacteroidota bacterium]
MTTGQTYNLAQENLKYQTPPASILQLADYERAPSVSIDTKKEYMLLSYFSTYKTLADLNQQEMSMGGLRINPVTNIGSSINYINNLKVRKVIDAETVQVKGLPENPRITFVTWSPDEKKIAFTHTSAYGVELWVLNVASASATRLTEPIVNANLGNPLNWYRNSRHLLIRLLPKVRPALINPKNELPDGPIVSVSDGSKSQNRTYPDLLKNTSDEINFVTLTTSELHKIDLNGKSELFKGEDMYAGESFSADGKYILVTTLRKPFTYIVPLNRFPQLSIVYDLAGKEVKTVNVVPLSEVLPKGFMAVRKGKRGLSWRPDQPSTLYFVEALDGGDPSVKVEYRDALYQWKAPFKEDPVFVSKTISRFSHVIWGNDSVAVLQDEWYDTRNEKTYLINPERADENPRIINDRNFQDIYSDPGNFETVKNEYGKYVLAIENNNLYSVGEGHTPQGQFPFVDEFNLKTLKSKRVYQSAYTDKMEEIIDVEDYKRGEALVRIQSKNEYPNYYFRNINKKNELTQITHFPNPFESIKDVYKEVIKYKRRDGVELSGTLYLPAGYDRTKKEKLPLLIWAYPAEYKDKHSAGQSTANPNEFTFPYYGSFVYWVTRGYAVLDDAAFPIIGEGQTEPNDTFIEQLVSNAKAAIDAVDSLGYINRRKVGIGGHSYGAFMTANLLTHSNLFACGIARSGAYNRTLTPFGFQSEQRNYWDTPDVYNDMSPFMNADKMKTPILLVHGEADNNPGTFTLQTERYFQALKGLGAPARMVILPKEQHAYVARENILHLLWEQNRFLEENLK